MTIFLRLIPSILVLIYASKIYAQPAVELGADGRTTVRGVVFDNRDSQTPVPNTFVFLIPQTLSEPPLTAKADENGLFEFVYRRIGTEPFTLFAVESDKRRCGLVTFRQEDYHDFQPAADVRGRLPNPGPSDVRRRLSVHVQRSPCNRVTGTVKDAAGQAVRGALVFTDGLDNRFRALTDELGNFEYYSEYRLPNSLCAMKPGVGVALMDRPNGKWRSAEEERKNNPFYDPVTFVLAPAAPFQVTVMDPMNNPVAGCKVFADCQGKYGGSCSLPFQGVTNEDGVLTIVDWIPKDLPFHVLFHIGPPDEVRLYPDGRNAKLLPYPEKNIYALKIPESGVRPNELKCVIPFKTELTVKIVNSFAATKGEPELKMPDIIGLAGIYGVSPDMSSHRNDANFEFPVYSTPKQRYRISCRLSGGETSVFPTVRGVMGDGFTPLETTITLQKGTALRLRLFDENGRRLDWQYPYVASVSESILPDDPPNINSWIWSYDFSDSLRKIDRSVRPGVEELVCFLPPGEFHVLAQVARPMPQQAATISASPREPTAPIKSIKDAERTVTVVPGKEVTLDFHVTETVR